MYILHTTTCSGVHVSKLTDLTLLICTPRFLCIPAHRIHRKIPKFQLAHLGPVKYILIQDIINMLSLIRENMESI